MAPGVRLRWVEDRDDLGSNPMEVGAEVGENACADPITLPNEPEEDVLGADVVVAHLQRLAERQLEDGTGVLSGLGADKADFEGRIVALLASLSAGGAEA